MLAEKPFMRLSTPSVRAISTPTVQNAFDRAPGACVRSCCLTLTLGHQVSLRCRNARDLVCSHV